MEQKGIPKFFGLRIYLSSILLYFFLVLPFIGFIIFQNVPSLLENRRSHPEQLAANVDSLRASLDTIAEFSQEQVDSIINLTLQGNIDSLTKKAEEIAGNAAFTTTPGSDSLQIGPLPDEHGGMQLFNQHGPFSRYFSLLFILLLVSLLTGFFFNRPFKRFFRKKRRNQKISMRLQSFCKKHLFRVPVVNSLIITMPNIVVIIYSMISLISEVKVEAEVERNMFIQLHYLTIVATLLEFLFVYYWERHRVHIRYIDHIYPETELRKKVFRSKRGKIRNRLMMASGMTTFLPLIVVMVYLLLSLTSIKDFKQTAFTEEQREILYGPWSKLIETGKATVDTGRKDKLFYVNAIDSIVMLVGIGNGILVSFIYLLLFIRWTNQDITRPVKELLTNIRNTRGGDKEQYSIVRTNDEIGELAEGYNEMTEKIHNYLENISAMNRELEEKVKERTREVVEQKEEIETQKEEIEAQLDLATLQRDTISNQNEKIMDSIRYAKRIQSAILPPVQLLKDHLPDHFILFKPRDIVSGDYYWAREKDQKLLIAVADCTGHGVPGGFLSMLGISSMNEIVNRSRELDPGTILEKLREIVINSLHQTGSRDEAQDGIEIALCVMDLKKKTMLYSGANRPLYLVREGSVNHLRPDRMPIGIYEQEPAPFTTQRLQLKHGDSIYLFSDGYVDQLGGPHRKTFRAINFRRVLLEIQDRPMLEQKSILLNNLASWQGEVEQIDDVLVMGFRI
jgi:serine phosphatase RsbU (regulator of sigma subunit)